MKNTITCFGRKGGQAVGLTYCLDKRDHDKHDIDLSDGSQPSVVAESPRPPAGYFGTPWEGVKSEHHLYEYSDGNRTIGFSRGLPVRLEPAQGAEQFTLSRDEAAWIVAFTAWMDRWS